jgi:hypothetical protein
MFWNKVVLPPIRDRFDAEMSAWTFLQMYERLKFGAAAAPPDARLYQGLEAGRHVFVMSPGASNIADTLRREYGYAVNPLESVPELTGLRRVG